MKLHPDHLDIVDPQAPVARLAMRDRANVQREMILDHAWVTGLPVDRAAMDWIESGLAEQFADHYRLKSNS